MTLEYVGYRSLHRTRKTKALVFAESDRKQIEKLALDDVDAGRDL